MFSCKNIQVRKRIELSLSYSLQHPYGAMFTLLVHLVIFLMFFLQDIRIWTILQHTIFQNCYAHNIQHKFDMICLWQTFLDSYIPPNDEILHIKGYRLVRAKNLSNRRLAFVLIS